MKPLLLLLVLFGCIASSAIARPHDPRFPVPSYCHSHSHCHAPPHPGVDWEGFTFGLNGVQTDFMWLDAIDTDSADADVDVDSSNACYYSSSPESCLIPVGPLALPPSATVLNYGQALFEGLKAVRRSDGSIIVFRPDRNALRMQTGAEKMLLPPVPKDVFLAAVDAVVRANARWVPPSSKGALYLRPLLLGTGPRLGVGPSPESTFCVYCSPVGNYFSSSRTGTGEVNERERKQKQKRTLKLATATATTTATATATTRPIRLLAVRGFGRAAAGGAGNVKAAGNYAPAFAVQKRVREEGCDEILCLDASTGEIVEEAGASNFFVVFPNRTIVTPSLDSGTILPGVTRASVLELAREECGCDVLETPNLKISDLVAAEHEHGNCASEAFCCGTGACITPVGSIYLGDANANANAKADANADANADADSDGNGNGRVVTFGDGTSPGPITEKLYQLLTDLQLGTNPMLNKKYKDWIHVVPPN